MSIQEIWQISAAVLLSLGGAGSVVMWLSSWLGKVWAARILESDRQKYTIEIERLRTRLQQETQLLLKQRDQSFNLSVTSHMATVAFNKHLDFCEEYAQRVNKGLSDLLASGPSPDAMTIAEELKLIRQKHAPWVTNDITEKLKPFELALLQVGTSARINQNMGGFIAERSNYINEMYITFCQVTGADVTDIRGVPVEQKPEIQVNRMFGHLQDVLGISELATLRSIVLKRAMQEREDI
jgi:hypothetical protein